MSFLARLGAYVGTADMSGIERRKEANVEYAQQLIKAERDYWYGMLRSLDRAEQDKARHELDHLEKLEAQANG